MTPKANRVIVLAARTARSKGYLQALRRAGIELHGVIFMGPPEVEVQSGPAVPDALVAKTAVTVPDLDEPLEVTCAQAGWETKYCDSRDVNDDEVRQAVAEIAPDLTIYSGYGGQLVRDPMLTGTSSFLHMHAGWLPRYRGSTTVYYQLLEENRCAVTAILLDSGIDTGPVVARKYYPPPPAGLDIDHVYDTAIRADLMVDVVSDLLRTGRLTPEPGTGDDTTARTYYVIHPVLKHVTLLNQGFATQASTANEGVP